MIFQHTIDKVRDGSKTQTSRIKKPGDQPFMTEYDGVPAIHSVYRAGRPLYVCGNSYAAQPGRGKRALDRIKILDIGDQDVREADQAFAKREGFECPEDFWMVWFAMHDKVAFREIRDLNRWLSMRYWLIDDSNRPELQEKLRSLARDLLPGGRPENYQAWVLQFEQLPESVSA